MSDAGAPEPTAPVEPGAGGITLTAKQLKQLRWSVRLLVSLVIVLGLALAITLPRTFAYEPLLEENIELKEHLFEIDRRMTEVDRLILRLRLYDSQLRSLGEPAGDHGPLPEDAFSNGRLLDVYERIDHNGMTIEIMAGDETLPGWVQPSDLRPAEAWAVAVQARVDTFLSLLTLAEPDLTAMMIELEDLRALEEALPSQWPASGNLTSGFGWRRAPIGRRAWKFHSGLDIAAKRGTPIYAPAPGVVVNASYNSGYGRVLEIDHGFGISTTFAHCNTHRVKEGDQVERGDLIATIGSTGRSTGPHLHFEVRLDGHPVDPLDYLPR